MNGKLIAIAVIVFGTLFFGHTIARAGNFEFTLSGGGSRLGADGGDELDGQWGPWIEPAFTLSPFKSVPQLRVGGGVQLAWISADVNNEFIEGQVDLYLITPEA